MTTHTEPPEEISCFKPRAEIERARQLNFATTMDLVAERHPHYRRVMAESGLKRRDFATLDDLAKLPITTKQDYIDLAYASGGSAWDNLLLSMGPTPIQAFSAAFVDQLAIDTD